jgi:hypothetical protein
MTDPLFREGNWKIVPYYSAVTRFFPRCQYLAMHLHYETSSLKRANRGDYIWEGCGTSRCSFCDEDIPDHIQALVVLLTRDKGDQDA